MLITVDRKYKKSDYTIGNLYIDGKWFCNTLEDADRGLDSSMSEDMIRTLKKPSITATDQADIQGYSLTVVLLPKETLHTHQQVGVLRQGIVVMDMQR
jgi:hypothetical protein